MNLTTQDVQIKESRHKRFMEREAKLRAIVRQARDCKDVDMDFNTGKDDGSNNDIETEMKANNDLPQVSHTTRENSTGRPMWAMTEEQAIKVAEYAELDATNELLDFANGLNFDKYIKDSEVSALIKSVRSRISELEANTDSQNFAEQQSV